MPNPKTKQHEALGMLTGHWDTVCKMASMPDMPGMEKASESKGTEHAELICNGLWLKSTIVGTGPDGKPFQGIWLAGYDPFKKHYSSVWVSNQEEPSCVFDGSYDDKAKTWTFTGSTPMGKVRSIYTFKDGDNSTETCYVTDSSGKETECMQIVRKRSKTATVSDATAKAPKAPTKEHALLHEGLGMWDASVKSTVPGQPVTEEKGTENVVAICDGRWTWSDFKGTMMGMPFEGHALCGYDANEKKFVSYWIDSCTPTFSKTTGTYDEAKKQYQFTGTSVCPDGEEATVNQVYSVKDKDTRTLQMAFKGENMSHDMSITYKRAKR
jgi:hypothetical protein